MAQTLVVARQQVFSMGGEKLAVMGLSRDGKILAASGAIWDTATGKELHRLEMRGDPVFSPDDTILALAPDQKGYIRLLDTGTWKEQRRFKAGHVSSQVFSPDGKFLAFGTSSSTRPKVQ